MSKGQFLKAGGTGYSRLAALAASLVVVVAGMAVSTPAAAQLSIKDSKHNLGTSGAAGQNQFSGTAEICVFCHTPHGADVSASVPLWNRTLPAPASFTTYDSLGTSTLDGKTAPVGSVSIACLSCHDGVTSMSAVINAPGSGLGGDAAWTAGTWTGPRVTSGNGTGSGQMTGVANLGRDLTNDHPIGIQYAGGGYRVGALAGPGTDPDFQPAQTALVGTTQVWWVDVPGVAGAAAGSRQKTDMMLYTRDVASVTGGAQPFVECASCHDPHQANTPTFLRISNAGSAVCLACHIK